MSPPPVRDRLARWERSGDPADLWPGLAKRDFLLAREEIAQVTRALLRSAPPTGPVEQQFRASPRAVGLAAFSSGMGPLLGYWIERGRLLAPPDVARLLSDHLDQGRARAAILDAMLGRVLDAFQERGIPATLLKGMHTAWEYFPEPGTRPCADVDLLVAPRKLRAAAAALAGLGFQARAVEADGLSGEWLAPSSRRDPVSLELTHRDDPWAVDLHGSLDRVFRMGLETGFGPYLPEDGPAIHRAGRTVRTLPQPLLLSWLATHTSFHLETSQLLRYLELVLVIRRDFHSRPALWDELLRLGERARCQRFLYPALSLAEDLAPGSIPAAVLRHLHRAAPRLMRRVVPRLRPETVQQLYGLSLDVRIMWAGSLREVLRFLAGRTRPAGGRRRGWRQVVAAQLRRLRLLRSGALWLRAPDDAP